MMSIAATDQGAAEVPRIALVEVVNENLPFTKAPNRKWRSKQYPWLETEPRWKNRLGDGWVGKKMLGQGGQGMVGHWKYEGGDRDQKSVKDIAVKQAVYLPLHRHGPAPDSGGLLRETAFYTRFQPYQTPHIPRMYTHIYEDQGNNTVSMDEGIVHRIFLEFCEGGSLSNWFGRYMEGPGGRLPIPEPELWAVFHCLSRSLLTIETGREEIGSANWTKMEICHFDLKPENVFVTGNLVDLQHKGLPAFKIGDFGCAKEVPEIQNRQFQKENSTRGTIKYLLPEQVQPGHQQELRRPWNYPSFTTGSRNIATYALRPRSTFLMMQPEVQTGEAYSFDWAGGEALGNYHSELNHKLRERGRTLATFEQIELERAGKDLKYSKALHALVAECLLLIPDERPTPTDLVKETGSQLLIAKMSAPATPDGDTPRSSLPPFREPTLSERWYSGQRRSVDEEIDHDDEWTVVLAQPTAPAPFKPAQALRSQARGMLSSLIRKRPGRRVSSNRGAGSLSSLPQQPLPGVQRTQNVIITATRPASPPAAPFKPRTNAPLLAPNLASRTMYKNITFVVDRGLLRGIDQYDFGSLNTRDCVYDRKVLLSGRAGIPAADMIFKAGGKVMENNMMLADYPILETRGIIDVAQL